MKVLNLVDSDKSDIKYQIINYPDGQKDIVILNRLDEIISGMHLSNFVSIQIKSRLNNAEDLLMIICANKALLNLKQEKLIPKIHLYTPYIMGLRSDRLFQEGGNRYVKDIIAPILNAQNFESVTCIDAHSSVAENCINNLISWTNEDLVKWVFMNHPQNTKSLENYILVSPDAGASHKIYKLAEQIGYKGDIITCSKERDKDGKLSKCVVPIGFKDLNNKDFIIIDDICDGGNTFINIANEIKKWPVANKSKIYLIVTHGIFSKGFKELEKYFDGIYCTNSFGILPNGANIFNADNNNLLKTLNVF